MNVIEGKALQVSDAIVSCQLDGAGGMIPIEDKDVINCERPCWLHLNYTQRQSAEWLQNTPLIPDSVRDALAGDSMRPRVTRLGDGFMIVLRSVNHNADSRPDQLVAMRVFINDKLIVSTRRRKVYAIDAVLTDLQNGNGPVDGGSWLVDVCDALTDHASEFIEEMHDKIIELEDALMNQEVPARGDLALLRKQLIVMRRYMAPQRDVYARLAIEKMAWMNDDDRRRMQEVADRLGRGLDDLNAGVARTSILADEVASILAESMNRRTYTMSLMAMIFLPATFLTGLFGVNLGGIPGGNWALGFTAFCVLLLAMVGGVAIWLKRRKWL
ncbi:MULTISPECIES: zinc transporter ZntB [Enterobacterales]|uniref:Zinc transport protein ZntB n=1 Tax=Candidatus Pantoea symbiotica TaxID=1884370 RepID=A0A1I3TQ35_9GAMM|nr:MULTISPECIES: zinc transporter ZntB [Pantoea]MBB3303612.1 zinc transporter [Enterobacter sp. Sphag1F]MDY0926764.1 zinc transporter ZntB [Enterobacter sp. CFBP8995]MRT25318.1 zinc transporter ZntB [Enterobacteriaceae bacterium RIT697]MRT42365.1 zinc transporter ZntB [Enterobacteriaceae bacterium RIT702]NWA59282.1 zinc transporter ZntB [Pantoea sp. B9002]NYI13283.1 zinc transporter [Enterobacter sp. Sphag71]